jgi:hypothetical protein
MTYLNRRRQELIELSVELMLTATSYFSLLPMEVASIIREYVFEKREYSLIANGVYSYQIKNKMQQIRFINESIFRTDAFDIFDFFHKMNWFVFTRDIMDASATYKIYCFYRYITKEHMNIDKSIYGISYGQRVLCSFRDFHFVPHECTSDCYYWVESLIDSQPTKKYCSAYQDRLDVLVQLIEQQTLYRIV